MIEKSSGEYPASHWKKTPSRLDGISDEEELKLRQKVCRFILTISSAIQNQDLNVEIKAFALVQAFYAKNSFKNSKIDKYDLGLAALFLSLKLRDTPRSIKELVLNQWAYLSPNVPLPGYCSKTMEERIKAITKAELLLVRSINFQFDCNINHQPQAVLDYFFSSAEKNHKEEFNILAKHFFYLFYHSFWTHVGLYHGHNEVSIACLINAVSEYNFSFGSPEKYSKIKISKTDNIQKFSEISTTQTSKKFEDNKEKLQKKLDSELNNKFNKENQNELLNINLNNKLKHSPNQLNNTLKNKIKDKLDKKTEIELNKNHKAEIIINDKTKNNLKRKLSPQKAQTSKNKMIKNTICNERELFKITDKMVVEKGFNLSEIKLICKALEFGSFHKPGEKSDYDKLSPVNIEKLKERNNFFKPQNQYQKNSSQKNHIQKNYGSRSRTRSPSTAEDEIFTRENLDLEGQMAIRIFDVPKNIKYIKKFQKIFHDEEISWGKFFLLKTEKIDALLCFRHIESIVELFRKKLFFDKNHNRFKIKFDLKICEAKIGTKERMGCFDEQPDESASVFVNNLSSSISERDLINAFRKFGSIVSVKISRSHSFHSNRYAFVNFFKSEAKNLALEKKYLLINGTEVDIFKCKNSEEPIKSQLDFGVQIEGSDLNKIGDFDLLESLQNFGHLSAFSILKTNKNSFGIKNIAFAFFVEQNEQEKALKTKRLEIKHKIFRLERLTFSKASLERLSFRYPVRVEGMKLGSSSFDLKGALRICGEIVATKVVIKTAQKLNKSVLIGYALFKAKTSQKLAIEMKNISVKNSRVKISLPNNS